MREVKKAVLIIALIIYPFIALLTLKTAPYVRYGPAETMRGLYNDIILRPLHFTFCMDSLKGIVIVTFFYVLIVASIYTNVKNYRNDEEYGSARWESFKKINQTYQAEHEVFENIPLIRQNKLMTEHVKMGFDFERDEHQKNMNTLVLGGSGTWKTRGFIIPNILQMNSSFVATDPKGELARKCGWALKQNGYRVLVFDVSNPWKSVCYNPFRYFRNDNDVLIFVTNYFTATGQKNAMHQDPFWEDQAKNLMLAFCYLLYHEAPAEEQNLATVLELLHAADVKDDEDYVSPVDLIFTRLEAEKPEHIAVRFYKDYHKGPAKTIQTIQSTLSSRLALFNIDDLAKLTMTDEIDIRSVAERKTAIFCVTPDDDKSKNFLVGTLYQQMFQQLYDVADNVYNGKLPTHVQFYLDEFANIALPDDYNNILSTARGRNISFTIILQDKSQIVNMYEKLWNNIFGNCDEILFLGSNEKETCEYMAELIGDETIYIRTYSKRWMGIFPEYTTNINKQGRKLMDAGEMRRKANRIAILIIRGEQPVKDTKINLNRHPNYYYVAEGKNLKRKDNPAKIYKWEDAPLSKGSLACVTDRQLMQQAVDIESIGDIKAAADMLTPEEILKRYAT